MLQLHIALGIRERLGILRIRRLGLLLDQFKDPGGTGDGVLQFRNHAGDLVKGFGVCLLYTSDAADD